MGRGVKFEAYWRNPSTEKNPNPKNHGATDVPGTVASRLDFFTTPAEIRRKRAQRPSTSELAGELVFRVTRWFQGRLSLIENSQLTKVVAILEGFSQKCNQIFEVQKGAPRNSKMQVTKPSLEIN